MLGLFVYAHGTNPEPALRIGAAIVVAGSRVIRLHGAVPVLRASAQIEEGQRGFRGNDQLLRIDPFRRADIFIELPTPRLIVFARVKAVRVYVEPEELLPPRMPERPFSKRTLGGV